MHFNLDKRTMLGPLLWITSIQYFIVQVIVIAAWTVPHSFANNFISDLGNTECGTYAGLPVCSPLHILMNISFVVFGITMIVGSLLLYKQFEKTKMSRVAFGMMVLSGLGTVMVGIFPENTINSLHMIGAVLSLGVGNLSILLLGLGLKGIHSLMRTYTILSALLSLVSFALFASGLYGVLGRGGIERLISYPFTVWMVAFGLYVVIVQLRAVRADKT